MPSASVPITSPALGADRRFSRAVVILVPVVLIRLGPARAVEVVRYSRAMYASPPAKRTRAQVPRTGSYARIRWPRTSWPVTR